MLTPVYAPAGVPVMEPRDPRELVVFGLGWLDRYREWRQVATHEQALAWSFLGQVLETCLQSRR